MTTPKLKTFKYNNECEDYMNNFELHIKAQTLSDTQTAYNLARDLVEARQLIRDLEVTVQGYEYQAKCDADLINHLVSEVSGTEPPINIQPNLGGSADE